ncbi:hypothetical protein FEM48_Zijuj05G0088300 [Ziziphus jujuba var. spinosa]|uniref:Uncharacterized protein n=1 Tax=Ziziphus jujuba var. spinosa TaxID=714518 RepID=A0A978VE03_ZIZJJ|nr:hypothetical protein FEM48_Zijuj05G0088300 [Ziziphus jujuba var. spinosa]
MAALKKIVVLQAALLVLAVLVVSAKADRLDFFKLLTTNNQKSGIILNSYIYIYIYSSIKSELFTKATHRSADALTSLSATSGARTAKNAYALSAYHRCVSALISRTTAIHHAHPPPPPLRSSNKCLPDPHDIRD